MSLFRMCSRYTAKCVPLHGWKVLPPSGKAAKQARTQSVSLTILYSSRMWNSNWTLMKQGLPVEPHPLVSRSHTSSLSKTSPPGKNSCTRSSLTTPKSASTPPSSPSRTPSPSLRSSPRSAPPSSRSRQTSSMWYGAPRGPPAPRTRSSTLRRSSLASHIRASCNACARHWRRRRPAQWS